VTTAGPARRSVSRNIPKPCTFPEKIAIRSGGFFRDFLVWNEGFYGG
jgi:hypothetical protein